MQPDDSIIRSTKGSGQDHVAPHQQEMHFGGCVSNYIHRVYRRITGAHHREIERKKKTHDGSSALRLLGCRWWWHLGLDPTGSRKTCTSWTIHAPLSYCVYNWLLRLFIKCKLSDDWFENLSILWNCPDYWVRWRSIHLDCLNWHRPGLAPHGFPTITLYLTLEAGKGRRRPRRKGTV